MDKNIEIDLKRIFKADFEVLVENEPKKSVAAIDFFNC
jgi:hypothetical protein